MNCVMLMRSAIASACATVIVSISPAIAADTIAKVGDWQVKRTTDSFTDVTRGIANTAIGDSVMVVKCDKPGPDSLYIIFITPKFLGSSHVNSKFYTGQFRLDDEAPNEIGDLYYDGRTASSDNKSVFLNMLASKNPHRIRLRLTNYEGDIVDFDASITGVADAIRQTAQICNDTKIAP